MSPNAVAADGAEHDRSSHSITQMLEKIRIGDHSAVDQLMSRLYADPQYGKMMRYAYGKLGSTGNQQDDSEAVIQEAMVHLAERAKKGRLETVDRRERLFGLLRLVVAEKARDFRRKGTARGGKRPQVSLNQPCSEDSAAAGLEDQLGDPASASNEERVDVQDLLQALLKRIGEDAPDPELWCTVFRLMLEDKGVSGIAKITERSRTQIDAIIDAIRKLAKGLRGDP